LPKPPDDGDGYFRAIVDALPAPVCRWLPDTTLTYANEAYRTLVAGRSDIVGRPWLDFVPEGRRNEVRAFYREWVRKPRTVSFEHEVRGAHGGTRWFSWIDAPLGDPGEGAEFQSIGIDITDRKQAEAERARIEANLVEAHKMEAIGRLAGGVAHDFNNMLGVILGHAELAVGTVDPRSPLHADLLAIRDAAERSADLTRQLLAFARKQPIAPEVLDLNEAVAGLLRMLRRLAGEDIELDWRPAEDLWPVAVDPAQVDQLLVNLVVNAREAILRAGEDRTADRHPVRRGTVTVRTRNFAVGVGGATDPAQTGLFSEEPPRDAPSGAYVVLSVHDDGAGIDPERLPLLFEPFFTTKGGRGAGLGLSTVYGIVKQNGGFVRVGSEPGGGTAFELHIPRHEPPTESGVGEAEALEGGMREERKEGESGAPGRDVRDAQAAGEGPGFGGSGRADAGPRGDGAGTVLVVEDEKPVLHIVKRVLERLGYTVLVADDPADAVALAEGSSRPIDLLLTDVVMPGMSGPEVFERIRRSRPEVRCLFMSGYPAEEITRHDLGPAVKFLAKPFSLDGLAGKVREALPGRD
jgi:two-component system, cell cycle sensor histidine kinase and response regulator CckA